MLYASHGMLLLTTIVQDFVSAIKSGYEDEEAGIFFGWMIEEPHYLFWSTELIYLLLTCWICLSCQYWINYPGLSKRQVL